MRLTLEALIVLEAIHRNRSFAKAADELHRVRSALTYTVNKLEEDLNIKIFDRTEHRPKLTAIGEVLLREGSQLLKEANELERMVKQLQSGWEEVITIAIDDTISVQKLFPLINEFYNACPHTRLVLSTEILSGGWDALISGRADIAIGVSGDPPLEGVYGLMPLGKMKFVFALSPTHPLSELPEPLKNSAIIKYRSIVVPDTSRTLIKRSSGTIAGQAVLTVPSIHAKIEAQIAGLGVGYLPLHLINDALKQKKLVIKKVEKPKPDALFSIAWRLKTAGKGTEWLLERLRSVGWANGPT